MHSRLWTGLGMALIGVVAAVVAFFGLLQWQHWRLDEANVHAMVDLVNYNVEQGTLKVRPKAP